MALDKSARIVIWWITVLWHLAKLMGWLCLFNRHFVYFHFEQQFINANKLRPRSSPTGFMRAALHECFDAFYCDIVKIITN